MIPAFKDLISLSKLKKKKNLINLMNCEPLQVYLYSQIGTPMLQLYGGVGTIVFSKYWDAGTGVGAQ